MRHLYIFIHLPTYICQRFLGSKQGILDEAMKSAWRLIYGHMLPNSKMSKILTFNNKKTDIDIVDRGKILKYKLTFNLVIIGKYVPLI